MAPLCVFVWDSEAKDNFFSFFGWKKQKGMRDEDRSWVFGKVRIASVRHRQFYSENLEKEKKQTKNSVEIYKDEREREREVVGVWFGLGLNLKVLKPKKAKLGASPGKGLLSSLVH